MLSVYLIERVYLLAYPKLPDVELGRREQFLLLDEGFEDETLILDTIVKWDVNDAFDSPYNSDLTYDLQQTALFGEMTYTLLDHFDLTAGLHRQPGKVLHSYPAYPRMGSVHPPGKGLLQAFSDCLQGTPATGQRTLHPGTPDTRPTTGTRL